MIQFFLFIFIVISTPAFIFGQDGDNTPVSPTNIILPGDSLTRIERFSFGFNAKDKGIKFYPNPTEGEISIEYETSTGSESIEVLDLLGNKIFEIPFQKTIDLSSLTRGIYFIRLLDKYKRLIVMERIVKK